MNKHILRFSLCVLTALPLLAQPSLKEAYKGKFTIGAALNQGHYRETDEQGSAIVKKHFNTITPENDMKWERIHPKPDTYNFEPADRYVEFGEKNGMFIVGHCLVWHSQTPRWVFENEKGEPLTRDALLARMREHIHAVVGRYKGRVHGWDVVNEALNEDGTMRESTWYKIIGEDYVSKAFEFAHEADPKAELYYNDYSLENEPKRNGAVALAGKLLEAGRTVTAIGTQHHDKLDWPTLQQVDDTIAAFKALGVKVCITELDVDVLPRAQRQNSSDVSATAGSAPDLNPYTAGLPEEVQQQLALRYGGLFGIFLKHDDAVTRVTFWGVTDRTSWLNNFPVRGRTNHALLWDRENRPKPAFEAVLKAVQ